VNGAVIGIHQPHVAAVLADATLNDGYMVVVSVAVWQRIFYFSKTIVGVG
jgi:hypothetical protein